MPKPIRPNKSSIKYRTADTFSLQQADEDILSIDEGDSKVPLPGDPRIARIDLPVEKSMRIGTSSIQVNRPSVLKSWVANVIL
ncbi:MAG: hypothetical protein ITG00_07585 [Flavobacterium sp.]|nr:hypothetical protein [Flavobacterium sp.]